MFIPPQIMDKYEQLMKFIGFDPSTYYIYIYYVLYLLYYTYIYICIIIVIYIYVYNNYKLYI
jgi:hypothetical protein